jgi:hypothetical protein
MKWLWMLGILMLVLAGCGGSAVPGGGRCNKGLCVKIEVVEPVRWGEPNVIRIIVTSEKEVPDLGISLMYLNKEIVVEEPEAGEQGQVVWKGDRVQAGSMNLPAGRFDAQCTFSAPRRTCRTYSKCHHTARTACCRLCSHLPHPRGRRSESHACRLFRDTGVGADNAAGVVAHTVPHPYAPPHFASLPSGHTHTRGVSFPLASSHSHIGRTSVRTVSDLECGRPSIRARYGTTSTIPTVCPLSSPTATSRG